MTCHHGLCNPVTLLGGVKSCSWSPAWREECEVRWLVNLPLDKRNQAFLLIAKKRGEESMRALETLVRISIENRRAAPLYWPSGRSTRSTPASTGARAPGAPSTSAGLRGQLF